MYYRNTTDVIATVGGGLVVAGIVLVGLLELLLGAPHPVDAEGRVAQDLLVPLDVRVGLILLGLAAWGLWPLSAVRESPPVDERAEAGEPEPID